MNFPRHWARGTSGDYACWRWSDNSQAEAAELAREAAAKLAQRVLVQGPGAAEHYGYADRPLREPVLQELLDAGGELTAVVTRNAHGCEVLNTARVLFVDVDLPESKPQAPEAPSLGGLFKSLFGQSTPQPKAVDPAEAAIAKAEAWARQHPGWNWRIYRTHAGLRLLATHALWEPSDPMCQAAFQATGADPLYRKLCQTQSSFRARLTPKPWRIGVTRRPEPWPFDGSVAEQRFNNWQRSYEAACRGKATCRFLRGVGSGEVHPGVQPLVELHDQRTLAHSNLPLS